MFLHNADCVGNCKPCSMYSMRAERCYDARHNAVLAELTCFISCHLSHCDWGKNYKITVDFPAEEYRPPHHLCPTNLKPDLVIWKMLNFLCSS